MYESVMEYLDWSTIVIKAAAVGDYTPSEKINGKIKKDENAMVLKLKNTKDILKTVGERKNGRFIVGFAAETDDLIEHAKDKLKRKNADLFIANDVSVPGAGFEAETNIVHFVYRDGRTEELPKAAKPEIARMIFDKIIELKSSTGRL
jgi:phosphopantothenoylcysteine decarboxylase/phosphopantothenate--cysteine ligase